MDIVVDLGQSGARVKIGDEVFKLPIPKKTNETVIETLEEIFKTLTQSEFEEVFLSLTGLLGDVGQVDPYGEICHRYFKAKRVYVMDDGLAAYFGALAEGNGVVLTLGGGVVAVSGNKGKFGHADGKGQIFGDFGGGFWLGQFGLRRAIATIDGRDDAHDLVEALQDELVVHSKLENKTSLEAAALCIASAKRVIEAAETNSRSALQILDIGASELSKTVIAAWLKVRESNQEVPELAFLGGLSQSKLYVDLIARQVQQKLNCKVTSAKGDHLAGAPIAARLYPEGRPPLMKCWKQVS